MLLLCLRRLTLLTTLTVNIETVLETEKEEWARARVCVYVCYEKGKGIKTEEQNYYALTINNKCKVTH